MVKLKCDWCGSSGQIIGKAKSFPGTKAAKCDVCHHEWEVVIEERDFTPEDHAAKSRWHKFVEKIKDIEWM
jgi:hypothetical protein